MQRINPPTLMPPPGNLYAQITVVETGRLAFISGQAPLDAQGALVGGTDHAAQALQVFRNLRAAVDSLGATPRQVVKMTIYVAQHRPDLISAIFEAGHQAFDGDWPIAASVLVGVETLAVPEWLVEVDAVVSLTT